jgi:hypothetical protein
VPIATIGTGRLKPAVRDGPQRAGAASVGSMGRAANSGCVSCRGPMPKGANFCPSCGVSGSPVEMLGLDDDPIAEGREVTLGRSSGASRRGWVIGSAVALLLVAAAVVVGRKNPKATSSESTPSTTAAPTASATTTKALARLNLGSAPLLGEPTGLEVWFEATFGNAVNLTDGVYRLDLDGAVLQQVAPMQDRDSGPPLAVVLGDAGFHIFGNGAFLTIVRRDGTVDSTRRVSESVMTADNLGVWVFEWGRDGSSDVTAIVRKGLDGSVIRTFNVPPGAFPAAPGDVGSFLLQTPDGRSFTLDGTTGAVTPVGAGVRAVRSGARLFVRCDDALRCQNLSTGADGIERMPDVPVGFVNGRLDLSPDGAWAMAASETSRVSGGAIAITAVNLVTAERVELGESEYTNSQLLPGAWSPDGRWFVMMTSSGINAWRPGLAAPIAIKLDIGDGVIGPYGIAIGPVAGS